jgi:hypothetical protein
MGSLSPGGFGGTGQSSTANQGGAGWVQNPYADALMGIPQNPNNFKQAAPPPPNFSNIAQQQALENHYDVSSPYSTNTWTQQTPGGPYTQNIQFSPQEQGLVNQFSSSVGQPLNNQATADIMQLQGPQIQQQQEMLNAQLAGQGFQPGDQAYNMAQNQFGQAVNSQLINAATQGIQTGIGEQEQPLGLLNQSQVATQFPGGIGGSPDLLTALNQGYNAQLGNVNASNAVTAQNFGGLMNLAGTLGAGSLMSGNGYQEPNSEQAYNQEVAGGATPNTF